MFVYNYTYVLLYCEDDLLHVPRDRSQKTRNDICLQLNNNKNLQLKKIQFLIRIKYIFVMIFFYYKISQKKV